MQPKSTTNLCPSTSLTAYCVSGGTVRGPTLLLAVRRVPAELDARQLHQSSIPVRLWRPPLAREYWQMHRYLVWKRRNVRKSTRLILHPDLVVAREVHRSHWFCVDDGTQPAGTSSIRIFATDFQESFDARRRLLVAPSRQGSSTRASSTSNRGDFSAAD